MSRSTDRDTSDQGSPDMDSTVEETRESRREKKRRSFRRSLVLLLRVALLSVFVVVYILVGAAVMYAIEGREEMRREALARAGEESILEGIVERLDVYINDRNTSRDIADEIAANISRAVGELQAFGPFFDTPRWDYERSVFFVTTAITTIGFGESVIQTSGGRAFIVLYAIFGIPVTVLLIATLSKLLARLFKTCLKPCRQSVTPLVVAYLGILLAGVILLIILPAIVFWQVEDETVFENFSTALYFCFITLSTIGFGDVVVLRGSGGLHTTSKAGTAVYTAFIVLWVFLGLAYLALLITEAVHGISSIWKRCAQKLPGGSTLAEEDFEERPLEKLIVKASRGLRKTVRNVIHHSNKGKSRNEKENQRSSIEVDILGHS